MTNDCVISVQENLVQESLKTETTPDSLLPRPNGDHLLEFPDIQPWPEPVDGQVLLDELAAILARFVVLPPDAAEALALWSLHTHAFQLRDVTTYLAIESPEKRCGKTTLLSVLRALVHRPISAANISASALYRVIQETRPTLLIDEADTLLNGNDELRGILNSGYTRDTSYVVRVGHSAPVRKTSGAPELSPINPGAPQLLRFSCWCPKAIAAIGDLPETLADRCIVIRMRRKSASESSDRLRYLAAAKTANLRRCCLRFVLDHSREIASGQPDIPPALNDRAADLWEPLLLLADLAGGDWPAKARKAALNLSASAIQHPPLHSLIIDVIVAFQILNKQKLFSRQIISQLNRFGDRPWSVLKDAKLLTERCLARLLRPYGVQPKTMWIDDDSGRGYEKQALTDALDHYVPNHERNALLDEMGLIRPPRPELEPNQTAPLTLP